MKVWVVVSPGLTMFSGLVFETKENVVAWWKETHPDTPGEIVDLPADEFRPRTLALGVVMAPGELPERDTEAIEVEVDAYFLMKARKEAEERRREEERKERELPDEPLGPCPKCGGKAVVNHPAYDGGAYVSCRKCGYSPQRLTWAETDKRAIYNWNHLPKEDEECRDR